MLPLFVGLCQGELKAKVHICLEEVKVYLGLDLGFVSVGFHSKIELDNSKSSETKAGLCCSSTWPSPGLKENASCDPILRTAFHKLQNVILTFSNTRGIYHGYSAGEK